MKPYSKIFPLLILFSLLDPALSKPQMAVWLGSSPPSSSEGFSVYGLKPGADFSELQRRLPGLGWRLRLISQENKRKTVSIQDRAGHHALIDVFQGKNSPETVDLISCYPLTEETSVELNGNQVFFWKDSSKAFKERLKHLRFHVLSQTSFEILASDQCLRVELSSSSDINSFALLARGARKKTRSR